jgi:glycosyltransferase involved in cell wall biosynthesis
MNILYLAVLGESDKAQTSGVKKKIIDQVIALNSIKEVECTLRLMVTDSNNDKSIKTLPSGKLIGIKEINLLRRRKIIFDKYFEAINKEKYDVIYLRYPLSDPWFYSFLRKLRNDLNVYIIVERQSIESVELLTNITLNKFVKYMFEIFYRKFTSRLINVHVAVTHEISNSIKKIDKESCVTVMGNGIQYSKSAYRSNWNKEKNIKLAYIGNIAAWSGLGDLIKSLNSISFLYKGFPVVLEIIGDGAYLNDLKKLAGELKLNKQVVFHGYLLGSKKKSTIEMCDYAIGSLSSLSRGIVEGSNLKLREYCLIGIPFCKSDYDSDFDQLSVDFALDIDQKKPLDDQVMAILSSAVKYKNNKEISRQMHIYAKNKLDWKIKFKKLFFEIGLIK